MPEAFFAALNRQPVNIPIQPKSKYRTRHPETLEACQCRMKHPGSPESQPSRELRIPGKLFLALGGSNELGKQTGKTLSRGRRQKVSPQRFRSRRHWQTTLQRERTKTPGEGHR